MSVRPFTSQHFSIESLPSPFSDSTTPSDCPFSPTSSSAASSSFDFFASPRGPRLRSLELPSLLDGDSEEPLISSKEDWGCGCCQHIEYASAFGAVDEPEDGEFEMRPAWWTPPPPAKCCSSSSSASARGLGIFIPSLDHPSPPKASNTFSLPPAPQSASLKRRRSSYDCAISTPPSLPSPSSSLLKVYHRGIVSHCVAFLSTEESSGMLADIKLLDIEEKKHRSKRKRENRRRRDKVLDSRSVNRAESARCLYLHPNLHQLSTASRINRRPNLHLSFVPPPQPPSSTASSSLLSLPSYQHLS